MWEAAREHALGRPVRLDRGADYDVTKAMFDFEYVLARDSSYLDVLHQYARLWREHEVPDRAIELGDAQIRLSSEVADVHVELLASYRHYVAWTRPQTALPWLEARGTPYARYFAGEIHRREGRLQEADDLFEQVLGEPYGMPPQPVLLSRARLEIARGAYERGYAYVEQAMRATTMVEARVLFPEFVHVMTEEEYDEALSFGTVEEIFAFYERMWAGRNPLPASRINWRLVEHFRRLVVAERDYEYFGPRRRFVAGEVGREREFPPAYWAARGLNDKGLIYVRHGEPDERVTTVPRPGVGWNASWRYHAEGLDFHFLIPEGEGTIGSWPLVPALSNCYMAEDRRHWGGLYTWIAPPLQIADSRTTPNPGDPCGEGAVGRDPVDLMHTIVEMTDAGRAFIRRGMRTDRHTWTDAVESFDFPFQVAAFRGIDGSTDVSIYYALPVGRFSEASPADTLIVETGVALHDETWSPEVRHASVSRYPRTTDRTAAAFGEMHFTVPPDSYLVSVHADLLDSPMLGGYQMGMGIPDFDRSETMMSDVVVAYDVRPIPGHAPTRRSSLRIVANPFHRIARDVPFHVYFELYDLAFDEDDRARYTVRYALEPQRREGGILGLFSRRAPGLSVSASFEDVTSSPIVLSQIDVGELADGPYEFVVHVTDETSGAEQSRRVQVELYERGP